MKTIYEEVGGLSGHLDVTLVIPSKNRPYTMTGSLEIYIILNQSP